MRTSRYDTADAVPPIGGVARRPLSPNLPTAQIAVPDPENPKERILARVNRNVDLLELERSHGRISEAAYMVGRIIQAVFEQAAGVRMGGGWAGGEKVDAATEDEIRLIRTLAKARLADDYVKRIEKVVGEVGAKFLRRLIMGEASFASEGAARGKGRDRGAAYAGDRFRWMLEEISEAWAGRAEPRTRPGRSH
ncbi:hypothetical protein SAMN05216548_10536 [Faunimonas pinastri]|uniref:Uncharacterized protein n=1 Tax=Faunimonas pinastri TaxID=1855383 RepID=A0A1H9GGY8_9HYPH|nr:hypothetical protein SAMN05216548_10536 [Faunimonas pinastri]